MKIETDAALLFFSFSLRFTLSATLALLSRLVLTLLFARRKVVKISNYNYLLTFMRFRVVINAFVVVAICLHRRTHICENAFGKFIFLFSIFLHIKTHFISLRVHHSKASSVHVYKFY